MSGTLDRIPPLPERRVTSTESYICPWCGCIHNGDFMVDENGTEHQDRYECGCGGRFEIALDDDTDDLITRGIRSDTDKRYMEAMGITEAAVYRHHFPPEG